jgi:hypothetical protein
MPLASCGCVDHLHRRVLLTRPRAPFTTPQLPSLRGESRRPRWDRAPRGRAARALCLVVVAGVTFSACSNSAEAERVQVPLRNVQGADVKGRFELARTGNETELSIDVQHDEPGPLSVALVALPCDELIERIQSGRTTRDAHQLLGASPHEHVGTLMLSTEGDTQTSIRIPERTLVDRARRLRQSFVFYRGVPGEARDAAPVQACAEVEERE